MSIHRRAARRDQNEDAIVAALEAAGASVTRIGAEGVPDLLCGYAGATYLLEVKAPLGARGGVHSNSHSLKSRGGDGVRTAAQVAWWAAWRGAPPVIVRTPAEALAAIGAVPSGCLTASTGNPRVTP